MRRVYIAGPYTHGDVAVNVRNAIEMADELVKSGYAPYVPHLTHFWHLTFPGPYEQWLALDFAWLAVCDAVVRLPGFSPGADRETAEAIKRGLPVYPSFQALLDSGF